MNRRKTSRVFFLIPILVSVATASFAADDVSGGRLSYRGFSVDMTAVPIDADFDPVENSVKHQIDIVADCGAKPDIIAFFRSVEIAMRPGERDNGGHFKPGKKEVTISAAIQPAQKPILLHEFLHAYHYYVLPGGIDNPDIERFYHQAVEAHVYPATESHDGRSFPTYLLFNDREFFAVTASAYLWGFVDREPHNRDRLKSLQPVYTDWLGQQFGVRY